MLGLFLASLMQGIQNRLDHQLDISEDVVIPEPQDTVPSLFKGPGSFGIKFSLLKVLAAIQFNDQFWAWGAKIDNVVPDSMLAPKPDVGELVRAQARP